MKDQYAEMAELAGGFIHEIKNHLSTLGLNLQLLAEDFQQPQSQRERRALNRIHKVQAQCQHLTEVANDFLRYARIKDLVLVPTHMGALVEEMVDFFAPIATTANIDIKTYVPADLPLVRLDPDVFKQALLNLILNAEQAMPQGGEITIQATPEYQVSAAGSAVEDGGNCDTAVVLHIIDTGKGIEAEVLSRIFEPFFSTKERGNGLGLPTTRRIIEAHGGSIRVESAVGRGTKFTVSLPAQVESPACH
jgi:signal transduction histidine kinase